MSAAGFAVDADAVDAHAGDVEGRAGRVRTAAKAGTTVGPDAFGLVGKAMSFFFTDHVITASTTLTTTLDDLGAAGERHGQALRDTVARYRDVEARIAAGFGGPR
ncbi:hypothetical protein [Pseudonocardia sp. N23]|uniref:hypothetical protein n=1 Tax=Pseudonocardia sp. N23 TaxID=1987376 RepID=UPI000BFD5FFD|nr:hypothetical protein [Pseudonocardia sp. N23]GAY11035.1 hypothetical protein TOK_5520 [Pseudonocardia sp. N23]